MYYRRKILLALLEAWWLFSKNRLSEAALLFAGIHLPTWLLYLPSVPLPFAIAGMTFLGIILGIVVRKTNSLWSAILIHSCYDLAVILVTSAVR